MRVGIDFRALARGTWSGVEEYVYQITRSLMSMYPDVEFRLFYNARRRVPLDYEWLRSPNIKLVESSLPNRVIDISGAMFSKPQIDAMLGGVDVFFSPHFFWASMRSAPRVITFADLSFKRYPEFFPLQKRLWHWRMMLAKQIRTAKHLIAVSESTKRDLMEYYRVPDDKITVIYEGFDKKEFSAMRKDHPWLLEFRRRNHLPQKFIFFLSTFEPRKNVSGIIRAYKFGRDSGKIPKDYHLVLGGSLGWLYKDIFRLVNDTDLKSAVHFARVKPSERKFWYNSADIFLFPSFFEGFGLPPLEAMACGVPVITSNRSSLPEVVRSAAITVDPYKPEEITMALGELIRDERLAEMLRKRGFDAAEEFSWEKAAKRTFEVLKSAI